MLNKQNGADVIAGTAQLYDAAVAILQSNPKISINQADPAQGIIRASFGVSMLSWGESFTIRIWPTSQNTSSFSVESGSHYALIDYGKNSDNVNWFMRQMLERFPLPNASSQPQPQYPRQNAQPQYGQPQYPQQNAQQQYGQPQPQYPRQNAQQRYLSGQADPYVKSVKGKGTAAFVCGLLSLFIPFAGIVLAILGVAFGAAAKNILPPGERGLATAGFILGLISIIWGIIWAVILVISML